MLTRVRGVLLGGCCLVILLSAVPSSAAAATAAGPTTRTVAVGPARGYGEAAASAAGNTTVVAATSFDPPMTALAWASSGGGWSGPTPLLPAGFTRSYDPWTTALSDGTVLVSAGASAGGNGACLPGGSVFVVRYRPGSGFGTPVIVDNQLGKAGFDDRPMIAAGPGGTVWAAWSHGTAAGECDVVGRNDQIEVAVSHDGGRSFSAPVALPRVAGGAAFGVRIAPLPTGSAALTWTELRPDGSFRVVFATVTGSGNPSPPVAVATGLTLPLVLPGASFYAFTTASVAPYGSGGVALAWATELAGRAVVEVSARTGPRSPWRTLTINPQAGADLLTPALAADGAGGVRLLTGVHLRVGDATTYASARLTPTSSGGIQLSTPLTLLAAPQPGPGFYEYGELLSLQTTRLPGHPLLGAAVLGSSAASTITLFSWPRVGAPRQAPGPAGNPQPVSGTSNSGSRSAGEGPSGGPSPLVIVIVIVAAGVVALVALRARQR